MTTFDPHTDQLLVTQEDRVAILTLNRPEARNALAPELSRGLREGIAWAEANNDIGALVITGAGKAFCSGGDVKAMGQRSEKAPPSLQSQFTDLQQRHRGISGALVQMRKPTIAALPGAAAGAGMAIALSTDIRVAADTAFLTTGYANIGLSGDYGIAWLLTRLVGSGRARELLLTADRVPSERAEAIGLVNKVVPAESLMEATMELAHKLANGPTVALRYIKDNLDEALSIDHMTAIDREADRLLKARSTSDHREAVQAFAEKRPPKFTGS